ncbi:MAG: SdpI family protein, partial [Candidatus Woesearchaeota archaeon]
MRFVQIMALSAVAASFVLATCLYAVMPETLASHWDSSGNVNGYMPRFWGLFLMPFVSIGILLLFWIIPRIDPLKRNIQRFRSYFDWFVIFILGFLFYVYLLTVFWNLGYRFNMTVFLLPGLSVLFYYIGVLMSNAKRNWFIGIRTPWTLSSDRVWEKTHRLGSLLFKISAVASLSCLVFPKYCVVIFLAVVLVAGLVPVVY